MDTRPSVQDALLYASGKLSIKFRKQQEEALTSFLLGHDVFVSLPTGFGKSVVFRGAPLCMDFLRGQQDVGFNSLAIVVMPLKSLIQDQLDNAKKSGISAVDLSGGITDKIREELASGCHSLILSSPEVLTGDSGRDLMTISTVRDRLCGLFVDESHCVKKWGQSTGKTKVFRESYNKIGELRSILPPVPVVALTATATKEVRRSIIESLSLKNYTTISASPDRSNIKHSFMKSSSNSPDTNLAFLVKELQDRGRDCDRFLVYCQSRKIVSEVYSMFMYQLPPTHKAYVQMYHTNSEDDVQQHIVKDFGDSKGTIRVLVATIAFGMGVDVQGCHNVIMYGVPSHIDDYVQMSGRVGRDGKKSLSICMKYPGDKKHGTSDEIKSYISGDSCRRAVIVDCFGEAQTSNVVHVLHECCDICALKCMCAGSTCDTPCYRLEHLAYESICGERKLSEFDVSVPSEEEHAKLERSLMQYRNSLLGSPESLYSGPDIACGLPSSVVDMILRDINVVIPKVEFLRRYRFGNKEIGEECWRIYSGSLHRGSISGDENDVPATCTNLYDSDEWSGDEYDEIILDDYHIDSDSN
nr:ATP-dependent DNA helicase RecQ-like [Lytechinus pictus]